ncbi:MAG: imidazole glycerol phosphate synthase subunit HisF [Roseivirga sp.]|nr:imidazole glycerol phosphate synthase subunit HisF [Roseivirga sp.]
MLKKRIVATVVVRNGIVVQSINFGRYLPVGKPLIALEFLNSWGIDEIILLDISASKEGQQPDYEMVRSASARSYVPLTVGGGISSVAHIRELMHCGADKISFNQMALQKPELISEAADVFGNQCVVVSIDALKTADGYRVYDYLKKETLGKTPAEFAASAEKLGAGEILINSVDRDGSYQGYDLDLIKPVCAAVNVPVIAAGGAKNADDFIEVLSQTEISAASAANFFHFTEHSVNRTKASIAQQLDVRLETHADYKENQFDKDGRLSKKTDQVLEDMLFVRIEKEEI